MKKLIIVLTVVLIFIFGFYYLIPADTQPQKDKIPVLCYHHVYDGNLKESVFKDSHTVLSLDLFEKHMEFLFDQGYYTATLDELADYLEGKIDLPEKTVVLTFDDGYSSIRDLVYPILKSFDFKGAVFVIGKFSEEANKDIHPSKNFKYLTFQALEEISDVFTIGSHTYDLHRLNSEAKPLLLANNAQEVKEDLQKMQTLFNTRYLAYPYGAYQEETFQILEQTGHRLAFTVDEGYLSPSTDRYEIPRFGIFSYTTVNKLSKILSPNI